ncbi:geminin [Asbolus verrucosus]|uniref:Geminin n=1 Tax=Asbolus verrucosus TaxID=1661398 RepID=A0A482VA45_ASBVE|nr:geminin [Asbolus verrucosus]
MRKEGLKIDSQEQKENMKNTRKTLKVLQQAATDKENLAGRIIIDKDAKLATTSSKQEVKRKKVEDKSVQTEEPNVTAEDLTSEEPSENYWKRLAEKREERLDESFQENERLKEALEALQEENRVCKEMLNESRNLVEVLQEMLEENEGDATEAAEEATEES